MHLLRDVGFYIKEVKKSREFDNKVSRIIFGLKALKVIGACKAASVVRR